jgi:hypothetical protein
VVRIPPPPFSKCNPRRNIVFEAPLINWRSVWFTALKPAFSFCSICDILFWTWLTEQVGRDRIVTPLTWIYVAFCRSGNVITVTGIANVGRYPRNSLSSVLGELLFVWPPYLFLTFLCCNYYSLIPWLADLRSSQYFLPLITAEFGSEGPVPVAARGLRFYCTEVCSEVTLQFHIHLHFSYYCMFILHFEQFSRRAVIT